MLEKIDQPSAKGKFLSWQRLVFNQIVLLVLLLCVFYSQRTCLIHFNSGGFQTNLNLITLAGWMIWFLLTLGLILVTTGKFLKGVAQKLWLRRVGVFMLILIIEALLMRFVFNQEPCKYIKLGPKPVISEQTADTNDTQDSSPKSTVIQEPGLTTKLALLRNDELGYELFYPESWQFEQRHLKDGTPSARTVVEADGTQIQLSVTVYDLSQEDETNLDLLELNWGAQERKEKTIGGLPALFLSTGKHVNQHQDQVILSEQITYLVINGNKKYRIYAGLWVREDQYKNLRKLIDEVIQSFRFTQLPPLELLLSENGHGIYVDHNQAFTFTYPKLFAEFVESDLSQVNQLPKEYQSLYRYEEAFGLSQNWQVKDYLDVIRRGNLFEIYVTGPYPNQTFSLTEVLQAEQLSLDGTIKVLYEQPDQQIQTVQLADRTGQLIRASFGIEGALKINKLCFDINLGISCVAIKSWQGDEAGLELITQQIIDSIRFYDN